MHPPSTNNHQQHQQYSTWVPKTLPFHLQVNHELLLLFLAPVAIKSQIQFIEFKSVQVHTGSHELPTHQYDIQYNVWFSAKPSPPSTASSCAWSWSSTCVPNIRIIGAISLQNLINTRVNWTQIPTLFFWPYVQHTSAYSTLAATL